MRLGWSILLFLLALAAGCGRTSVLDFYPTASTGGSTASIGGSWGALGSGGQGGDGSGGSGAAENRPRFDCNAAASQSFDPQNMAPYRVSEQEREEANSLLELMSPQEKFRQMTGVYGSAQDWRDIQRSFDVQISSGATIRGYRYRDAGRGVNLDAGQDNRFEDRNNFSTAFPAASLRAASWDLDLERRVGAAIGEETAASLNNALMAPCMNVIRHPYWGRTQESYGEDVYHTGRMATAMAVGIQEYVVGCAKHFAANNIEQERSLQNATMTEQTLREIYTRHFEMVVQDGGVGCVMAAYNSINGVKSTQNRHLIREILKAPVDEAGMGFEGFVITDWWAMPGEYEEPELPIALEQTIEAVFAGTDVEVPWMYHYSDATLPSADPELVDEAVRRILTQKLRFNTAFETDGWGRQPTTSILEEGSLAPNEAHEALAEEAALRSIVLLKNGIGSDSGPLPLHSPMRVAVIGLAQNFHQVSSTLPKSCDVSDVPSGEVTARDCVFAFATDPALGDRGSGRVNADPERAIGPFQGIFEAAGDSRTVTSGIAVEDASQADAVVVIVGYTPGDEGEEYTIATGGDRRSLDLPPGHNELVESVLDLNKPTVIVIESGSIVNLPWLSHQNTNQATIWAGYPGMRGGAALGALLFGQANFSGKMPLAWPRQEELLPFQDDDLETEMGYFFGYREFDRRRYVEGQPVEMVFPFGHGLSYSKFVYSNLTLPCQEAGLEAVFNVTVEVTNSSSVDGDEVVMLFVKPPAKPPSVVGQRPWKELKSFVRVSVPAGQTVTAELPLRVSDLRRWEGDEEGAWVVDSGDYTLVVAENAAAAETTENRATLRIDGE